jgi:hypothetical protein
MLFSFKLRKRYFDSNCLYSLFRMLILPFYTIFYINTVLFVQSPSPTRITLLCRELPSSPKLPSKGPSALTVVELRKAGDDTGYPFAKADTIRQHLFWF